MSLGRPVLFTRGLGTDGRWLADEGLSVLGDFGGHIGFLDGSVNSYLPLSLPNEPPWWDWRKRQRWKEQRQTREAQFLDLAGNPTSNVLDAISPDQAIYSFPATPTGISPGTAGARATLMVSLWFRVSRFAVGALLVAGDVFHRGTAAKAGRA